MSHDVKWNERSRCETFGGKFIFSKFGHVTELWRHKVEKMAKIPLFLKMDAPRNGCSVWLAVFTIRRKNKFLKKKSTTASCEFKVFGTQFFVKVKNFEFLRKFCYLFVNISKTKQKPLKTLGIRRKYFLWRIQKYSCLRY